MSLELQRFWALLKVHSIELHAKFGEGRVGGCGGVLVRDFFLPACRVGGGSGTKFSLHAKSGPKSAFWGLLGEFCTGWAAEPLAGRVLYRVGRRARRAGRVLYRVWSSEVVQDEFRFLTHLEEIRRWSSRMRRGTLG